MFFFQAFQLAVSIDCKVEVLGLLSLQIPRICRNGANNTLAQHIVDLEFIRMVPLPGVSFSLDLCTPSKESGMRLSNELHLNLGFDL